MTDFFNGKSEANIYLSPCIGVFCYHVLHTYKFQHILCHPDITLVFIFADLLLDIFTESYILPKLDDVAALFSYIFLSAYSEDYLYQNVFFSLYLTLRLHRSNINHTNSITGWYICRLEIIMCLLDLFSLLRLHQIKGRTHKKYSSL